MISLHVFVTDFIAVISPQSEGLGKMALGIVKIYLGSPFPANRRCSRSVVVDPHFREIPLILVPPNFVKNYLIFLIVNRKNFICLMCMVKKF